VRRGRLLNRLTIGWNAVEGIVAVVAGSVSLVGFAWTPASRSPPAVILASRLAQERRRAVTRRERHLLIVVWFDEFAVSNSAPARRRAARPHPGARHTTSGH